ncbi:PREDICTED: PRUPE_5G010700 [Prunus dulcis]|uniref:PREDICTED: PRUPE_5G010700 n=1 Tax=Prunus dulcis TaxID=3755 RepID=A0A5E4FY23_PRUDU|nr:PREDICTED: PRUPE_5G010700 [Prunus dulcis]
MGFEASRVVLRERAHIWFGLLPSLFFSLDLFPFAISLGRRDDVVTQTLLSHPPPNFISQLSTKALRNSNNIDVAQIVVSSNRSGQPFGSFEGGLVLEI